MLRIPLKEFQFWKKKQLSKGGDLQSFDFLLDVIGGLSQKNLNLLSIHQEESLDLKENLDHLETIWDKHIQSSTPIQYLCGMTFWRDLKLKVTNKVLIPRSDSELLIDIVFKLFGKTSNKLFFAELGTGSGAISIALALAYPLWEGVATDIDQDALEVAYKNYINSSERKNLRF